MNPSTPSQPHPQAQGPELSESLRQVPSVDSLLRHAAIMRLLDEFPRSELLLATRAVLEQRRSALLAGASAALDVPAIALDIRQRLHQRNQSHLRRVINATGIVLHTGLGRAPLPQEAIEAVTQVASGYCNLELDLATGERGDRHEHVRELLCELTGAESGLVVNNNAAATLLTLRALAFEREVIVSRGQLVEIGGSYRMPEIMAAAGCRMVEVGTTNRTRIGDYQRAITPQTAALLRVHTSNYRIEGFVESVEIAQLAALRDKRAAELCVLDDLGSGLLEAPSSAAAFGDAGRRPFAGSDAPAWDEPSVRESISHGADVVLFSGDKLLGGPQAGVIVGRRALLDRLQRDPLMRTFRPDKMTLAALEATLRLYRDPAALRRKLPVQAMLHRTRTELEHAAQELAAGIGAALPGATIACEPDRSFAGGGSLPTLAFDTFVVRVRLRGVECAHLAQSLRLREQPVICRLHDASLVFDVRTLLGGDSEAIVAALCELAR